MDTTLPITARFRVFAPRPRVREGVTACQYSVKPVPGGKNDGYQVELSFDSLLHGDPPGANPEEEVELVAALLALCLGAHVKTVGVLMNGVDVHSLAAGSERRVDEDLLALPELIENALRLPKSLLKQFVRSAEAFSLAAEQAPANSTLSFFLLVVTVECLSTQDEVLPFKELHPEGKTCERFVQFLLGTTDPEQRGPSIRDEEHFVKLLKTVYYRHRSGFVHGGRAVSLASGIAQRLGVEFVKNVESGKDVETPSLDWFKCLVRSALVSFVSTFVAENPGGKDDQAFGKLAIDRGTLNFRAVRDLKKGQIVRAEDVGLA